MRAPYVDPAMIVRSPRNLYDKLWDKKSYGDRRETARAQSEIEGTPDEHRTGSVRFPLQLCGYPTISVRFRNDIRTVLIQNVDESQCKKSCDARMNCKHIRRSPRSPTMSKIVGKIADRKLNRTMIGA